MNKSKINKLVDHIEYTVIAIGGITKDIDGYQNDFERSEKEIDSRLDRELAARELKFLVEQLEKEIQYDDIPF